MNGNRLNNMKAALMTFGWICLWACDFGLEPEMPFLEEKRDCYDGVDNDNDGRTDYPSDPGCESFLDPAEGDPLIPRACSDGVDNDGDGRTDFDQNNNGLTDPEDDPGCENAADDDELNLVLPECADGVDNDRDGQTDVEDSDCLNRNDDSEAPECADGQDNDSDGFTDFPADPNCDDISDSDERN